MSPKESDKSDDLRRAPAEHRDEKATERGTYRKPHRLCGALHADGGAELAPIYRLRDDRHRVGLQHGGAKGLRDAGGDERPQASGCATNRRTRREYHKAQRIKRLPPKHVGQPAEHDHQTDQGEQVGDGDPLDIGEMFVEDHPQRGDGGIQLAHERAETDCAHHPIAVSGPRAKPWQRQPPRERTVPCRCPQQAGLPIRPATVAIGRTHWH